MIENGQGIDWNFKKYDRPRSGNFWLGTTKLSAKQIMLTQIKLTNFKCFKSETIFPLSQFNLLTGVNGSGKSTLLQSLLLMRQSIEDDRYTTRLVLNGSCVNLGNFDDVRNREVSANEPMVFEFSASGDSTHSIRYHFDHNYPSDDMSISISRVTKDDDVIFDWTDSLLGIKSLERFLYKLEALEKRWPMFYQEDLYFMFEETHFISADRIGPQDSYQKVALPKFTHVGAKGEFTVNLLNKMRDEWVAETLCLGEGSKTLMTQTEAWLGKILSPVTLEIPPSKTNLLELFIGGTKPTNVGFGYSIILPIIVSGLIAKPGEKLIVENPEIHLHPKAQTALIQFLVAVAKTGVQVFVESHSDHVLNALRIVVFEKQLTPEELSILYFQNDITSILVDRKGKLHRKTAEGATARIPKGFFDEWTNSMAKLF